MIGGHAVTLKTFPQVVIVQNAIGRDKVLVWGHAKVEEEEIGEVESRICRCSLGCPG
jgi:hypothetical protein